MEPEEIASDLDRVLVHLTARNVYSVLGRPLTVSLSLLNALMGTEHTSRHTRFDIDTAALLQWHSLRRLLRQAINSLRHLRRDDLLRILPGIKVRFTPHHSVELVRLCDATWSMTLDLVDARHVATI